MNNKALKINDIGKAIQDNDKNTVVVDYTPFPDEMLKDDYMPSIFISDKGQDK